MILKKTNFQFHNKILVNLLPSYMDVSSRAVYYTINKKGGQTFC